MELAPQVPRDVARLLAERVRELRLRNGWKRATLAERSGVSEASLKRFERTGEVSLASFLALSHALGRLHELAALLRPPPAQSIVELEQMTTMRLPKRGRR